MSAITRAKLKRFLHYDPLTGIWTWLAKTTPAAHRIKVGAKAGNADSHGHIQIRIFGRTYSAHRLAWFYMTGKWPKRFVDHENTVPGDNRWVNLREATRSQNVMNSKKRCDGLVPLKGVCFYAHSGRYGAKIRLNGKQHYLGCRDTPEEAHALYADAAKRLFGEFARMK